MAVRTIRGEVLWPPRFRPWTYPPLVREPHPRSQFEVVRATPAEPPPAKRMPVAKPAVPKPPAPKPDAPTPAAPPAGKKAPPELPPDLARQPKPPPPAVLARQAAMPPAALPAPAASPDAVKNPPPHQPHPSGKKAPPLIAIAKEAPAQRSPVSAGPGAGQPPIAKRPPLGILPAKAASDATAITYPYTTITIAKQPAPPGEPGLQAPMAVDAPPVGAGTGRPPLSRPPLQPASPHRPTPGVPADAPTQMDDPTLATAIANAIEATTQLNAALAAEPAPVAGPTAGDPACRRSGPLCRGRGRC